MLRRFVAIYLILVLSAGPSLCCCGLTHRVADDSTSGPAATDAPRCPCCADTPPSPPGDPSPPHKPDCPCRQRADTLVAVVEAPAEILPDGLAFVFVGFLTIPSGDLLPAHLTATSADSSLPFWSAGDLLRTHHQLRC